MLRASRRRHTRGTAATALLASLLLIIGTGMSVAFWIGTGTGVASAASGTLSAPTGVAASVAGQTVTVAWTAGTKPAGSTLSGYFVTRTSGATTTPACGSSPTSLLPVTPTTCNDTSVPAGTYTYRVTAVLNTWTAQSAASDPVTVAPAVDTTPPTMTLASTAENGAWLGPWSGQYRLYFNSDNSGSFRFAATVTDNQSGPASVNFPAASALRWTHSDETVTSGTGSFPTITYTSSTWSWTPLLGVVGTPTVRTLTARDVAGNPSTRTVTFQSDTAAPAGGALTVNGVTASTAGSSSSNGTGTFTIGTRIDFTETQTASQSGLAASTLTREMAPYTNGSCGTYGSATEIVDSPTQTVPHGCYRYRLTGTDRVGNATPLTTTVRVDLTSPTDGALSANGTAATGGAGSQSTSTTGNWALTWTHYSDPDSGMESSRLTEATAPLTPTGCGTFGTAADVAGTPTLNVSGKALGCYRYVLTGTNGVGGVSTLTTTVRRISPPATVTGVQTINVTGGGNVAGRMQNGDRLVITFSEAIRPSSFCSAWTDSSGNQSINGNNQATATLSTAPDPDQLVITSSLCTFNLGTISLGSNGYSTVGNITFAGLGNNSTDLTWNPTARALTIEFGTGSAIGATVTSSVITFTPSAALQTVGAASVTGSFATGNIQQF